MNVSLLLKKPIFDFDFNSAPVMTIVSKTKISFPNLQRYKLLIEQDQRLKFECRITMSVSCIIFIIFQTHANGCDFMATYFYFYIKAIF